ncbi:hypothetical protein PH547_32920 [Rhizobium sp. CNPSo 3464]|uniref:hypothetical protein n=1 Tax=Rhizobium sp. CNPSo 3464 TaxID=3021406 RepID=UPI00254D219D|nr:hypothetical protein [Rhizobium sp. CNPSo 3464]MDK4743654.1 hypothetical protein [Rhizobium sp. CNPSo 3464]
MTILARISRLSASGALLLLAFLSGGSALAAGQNVEATPSVRSRVPGLEITLLSQLPKAPASAQSREECDALVTPKSEGGKAADALGWGVTGEAKLGPYDAVSFAGEFDPSTAGSCEIDQGNIALFNGSQLLVIIYANKNSKLSIGRIVSAQGSLRIVDGGLVQLPVGDVRLVDGHVIEVEPLAKQESVCGGKAVVPDVHGKPVVEARAAIIAEGWEPFRSPAPSYEDYAGDEIRKSGIIEATDCSATDLASCNYYYHKGDMELSLTSFGDGKPTVSDYQATCERSKWHTAN